MQKTQCSMKNIEMPSVKGIYVVASSLTERFHLFVWCCNWLKPNNRMKGETKDLKCWIFYVWVHLELDFFRNKYFKNFDYIFFLQLKCCKVKIFLYLVLYISISIKSSSSTSFFNFQRMIVTLSELLLLVNGTKDSFCSMLESRSRLSANDERESEVELNKRWWMHN